jgi:hypothetical protein
VVSKFVYRQKPGQRVTDQGKKIEEFILSHWDSFSYMPTKKNASIAKYEGVPLSRLKMPVLAKIISLEYGRKISTRRVRKICSLLADQRKQALATYTESGGKGTPSVDTAQAITVMHEKHKVVCVILHGFTWSKWTTGSASERLSLIQAAQQHVLQQEDGKTRFGQVVADFSQAFARCAASGELWDDMSFFQALMSALRGEVPQGI